MKKLLFFIVFSLLGSTAVLASDLISAVPKNGVGKQIVSIHSCGGQTKAEEGAYNLLYNASDGENSRKKWVNTSNLFPWVVFELTDIYAIEKIVFRDVKSFEPAYGNIPQYRIEVSLEHPDECMWEEVALKKRQGGFNVKELTFETPVKARYVKFTAWRGQLLTGSSDNGVRIYGFDMYGTLSEKVERESISVGKTILGSNNTSSTQYYEQALNILDGNKTNIANVWRSSRPSTSDTLRWVVIDLEKKYKINQFKLYDAKTLDTDYINISGYNVYLSTEMPDLEKIKENEDENTCWVKVVDAYEKNRLSDNIKTDVIIPEEARYVKLEIPRSKATGFIRLFQFEVFGEEVIEQNALSNIKESSFTIYPNPVKRGGAVKISAGNGLLQIYSLEGTLVYEQNISNENNTFSTAGLHTGIYLVQIMNQNGSESAKLIVE